MTFTDDVQAFFWMVGVLEGEASFCFAPPSRPNCPFISIEMTDEDVVQRIAAFWGVSVCAPRRAHEHHKLAYAAKITGSRAVEIMRTVLPYMSQRRQERIEQILASYGKRDV